MTNHILQLHRVYSTIVLKATVAAFKERDTNPDAYEISRYDLWRGIKRAKRQYRTKIKSYYTGSDAHRMWQGLQTQKFTKLTNYNVKPRCERPSDASLQEELNAFYAHFEANNTEPFVRAPAVLDNCVIMLSIAPARPLNRLTFTMPHAQKHYQNTYSERWPAV